MDPNITLLIVQTVHQLKIQLNLTLHSSIIVKANPFENAEAEEQEEELFEHQEAQEGNTFF